MTIAARLSPTPDHPGIGLSGLIPDPRARAAVFLAGLGVSLWVTASGLAPHAGIAALAALALAGSAWLMLAVANTGPLVPAAVAVMGAAGGVIAVTDQYGLIFAGVAAASAAVTFGPPTAAVLTAASPAAFAVTTALQGTFPGRLLEAATACLAGMVAGVSRREAAQRGRQAALVATATQRAEVASQQAELATERIRLGRELHDVLAHTLGALSIQLTALDTLARNGTGPRAEARLALYRAVQEALTNAARHAPSADVAVRLAFGSGEVTVSVLNSRPRPAARSRPSGTGGGYGLRGMRERVLQAGGQLQAGPADDGGWQVTARIPA